MNQGSQFSSRGPDRTSAAAGAVHGHSPLALQPRTRTGSGQGASVPHIGISELEPQMQVREQRRPVGSPIEAHEAACGEKKADCAAERLIRPTTYSRT